MKTALPCIYIPDIKPAGKTPPVLPRPCRDHTHDCAEMTLRQVCACSGNPGPADDQTGFCIAAKRLN